MGHRIGSIIVVVGLLVASRSAHGQFIEFVEPTGTVLDLGPVNIGTTSQPRRIILKNSGTASPRLVEVSVYNPAFTIVGSGGDLEPGHTAYWDIVAAPVTDDCFGDFTYAYTTANDNDLSTTKYLSCNARNVPLDADPVHFGRIGPTTVATRRLTVVNTTAAPLAIAAITSSDPTYTVTLRGGSLPLTLAPEGILELDVRFAPTAPVMFHETSIAATLADGTSHVITQGFGATHDWVVFRARGNTENTPVGAPWRRYGWLANYTSQPIVVTAVEVTDPQVEVIGIAAGEAVPAHTEIPLLTQIKPFAQGPISADLTLRFDTAAALTEHVEAFGRTTALELTTEDAVPDDGQLDFGTLSPSSPPVTRKITITNRGDSGVFIDWTNYYADQGFTADRHSGVLWGGESMEVAVTFTPGSPQPVPFADRRIGAVRFTELGTNHYIVELTAVIPSFTIAVSADQLTFPDTVRAPAAPTTLDLTVTNTGVTPMPVPPATVTGAGFRLETAPPPGMVVPLASVVYRVAFEPPAVGTFDGVLSIEGAPDIPLHGNGVPRAEPGCATGRGPGSWVVGLVVIGLIVCRRRRAVAARAPGR